MRDKNKEVASTAATALTPEQASRRQRTLLAFLSEETARNFWNSSLPPKPTQDEFRVLWSKAVQARSDLKPVPLQTAVVADLDRPDVAERLRVSDAFAQATRGVAWKLGWVDLGRLVCFQRQIDADFSDAMMAALKTDESAIELCLPRQFEQEVSITFGPDAPAVSFSSMKPHLVLTSMQILGTAGEPITVGDQVYKQPAVIFGVGTNINYLQVAHYGERYLLKNGYHRVLAALLAGRDRLPALVLEAREYAATGAQMAGAFGESLLMAERPPLLADYLDARLWTEGYHPAMRKVIRVRADEFSVPR